MTAAAAARQRVDSSARVDAKSVDGRSVLHRLDQRGGAKIRLPRPDGNALEAVLINTAGGLTGGDRVDWTCRAGPHTRLVVSTAASEKAYRSHGPVAVQHTRLMVEQDAALAWLPQETIVFDGAALSRRLEVSLAGNASCLLSEVLVFGRSASGERVQRGRVTDQWRVWRDGKLVHAEALHVDAAIDLAAGSGTWRRGADSCNTLATVLWCTPLDDEQLTRQATRLRELARGAAATVSGVSVLPGRLVIRMLATDSARLRAALLPMLSVLNHGADVPRVWYV